MVDLERQLSKFAKEKVANYDEPTRKGTPKGEPVGFSLKKYRASLLTLTNKSIEDQAKEIGVSYAVLRKWRSEQDFKDLVSRHEHEFFDFMLRSVGHPELKQTRTVEIEDVKRILQLSRDALKSSLALFMNESVQQELVKAKVDPEVRTTYQRLTLDQAIELLQDRRGAIKHRKDLINLLSGVKETLE